MRLMSKAIAVFLVALLPGMGAEAAGPGGKAPQGGKPPAQHQQGRPQQRPHQQRPQQRPQQRSPQVENKRQPQQRRQPHMDEVRRQGERRENFEHDARMREHRVVNPEWRHKHRYFCRGKWYDFPEEFSGFYNGKRYTLHSEDWISMLGELAFIALFTQQVNNPYYIIYNYDNGRIIHVL